MRVNNGAAEIGNSEITKPYTVPVRFVDCLHNIEKLTQARGLAVQSITSFSTTLNLQHS